MCFPRPIDSLKRYIDVCVIEQCTEKIMRNNTVEGQPSQTHQTECCDSDGARIRESWGTRKNIDNLVAVRRAADSSTSLLFGRFPLYQSSPSTSAAPTRRGAGGAFIGSSSHAYHQDKLKICPAAAGGEEVRRDVTSNRNLHIIPAAQPHNRG